MQHISVVDQVQLIDQQLHRCELSPGEQAAVDEFRIWSSRHSSHLKQKHADTLGSYPAEDMVEREAWQARKQQLDKTLECELANERSLRGSLLDLHVACYRPGS